MATHAKQDGTVGQDAGERTGRRSGIGISRRRFLGGAAARAAPAAIGVGGLLAAESRPDRAAAETLVHGGRLLHLLSVAGMLVGIALLYVTGLLVSV